MTNAVVALVCERVRARSRPGDRTDNAVLGLCIEGGAMRGVVSAGMVAGIEQLNALPAFDLVVGCSAGAANGAYLVAGHATAGSTIYFENINNRKFIDPARPLRRRPIVDLDYLVADVMIRQKPLDTARILASPIPLIVVATSVDSGDSEALCDFKDATDVLGSIRASATMPILAGPPFQHRGHRYWDGSLTEPVPVVTAVRLGCTHVLVLLTRPAGVGRPPLSPFQRRVILPRIRRVSPTLAEHFARQHEEYLEVMARIEQMSEVLLALRPPAPTISNLERRRSVLVDGARQGREAVMRVFGGIRGVG